MPPFSDQDRRPAGAENEDARIISPLKVHPTDAEQDSASKRWIRPAALVAGLAILIAAGVWLIGYLSQNPPLSPVRDEKNPARRSAAADRPETPTAPPPRPAADPATEESGAPAALPASGDAQVQEVSDEVLSLMDKGRQHERQKEFHPAREAYREAYRIDNQHQAAATAIERVSDKIAEEEYRQALAAGTDLLEKGAYDAARKQLIRAKSLRPGAAEARAALAKLDRTVRRNRIAALKQMGGKAETAEDWQAAQNHYASILALDPDHSYARQGVDRAQQQMRVLTTVRSLVDQPDTLLKKAGRDKALATLQEARALDPRGPQLEQHLGRLEKLMAEMQKPVRLTIGSDNQTHVDVYRIGRLGRFVEKVLELKPGVYVVVGHREGYQDVRHEITIRPGEPEQRVTVVCRVKV